MKNLEIYTTEALGLKKRTICEVLHDIYSEDFTDFEESSRKCEAWRQEVIELEAIA